MIKTTKFKGLLEMSKNLQPIRGTRDLFGAEIRQQAEVINKATSVMSGYGYHPISTPIFEESEVFFRTLGDTSDIVTKETYTFNDREKTSITLRPELTASMVRALISNGMTQTLPQKFYAVGPVFRHERPQKCRYRQFTQIDCEYFGAKHPLTDVETIKLGADIITKLGLQDVVTLELNSLGDKESRAAYNNNLVNFLQRYEKDLSPESQARLAKNPMRILDSKDENDRRLITGAPSMKDCYNQHSADYWKDVLAGLDAMELKYQINDGLVRGLDYYCHTVFEFTTSQLGSQGTVLAGGRFDGLSEMMGGPRIESIGFAAGLERLSELQQALAITPPATPFAYIIAVGEELLTPAMKISTQLRAQGLVIHQDFSDNLGKSLRKANSMNAAVCLILGQDELQHNVIKVKNMVTGYEEIAKISEVRTLLSSMMGV